MPDRCQRQQCGRKLTDPNSQLLGYGPVCYRKQFGRPAPVKGAAPVGPIALFDVPGAPVKPLGRDARRTLRQAQEIQRGFHPLGVALRIFLPLHPDAPRGDDRQAPGPRCVSCVHRVLPIRETAGTYPKCNFGGDLRRATAGPGTDCRKWWPACQDYEFKENRK